MRGSVHAGRMGEEAGTSGRRWPIVAIFVLSGAAGLIYEVVWARQLVLVFGNTTQAVSAILTGFFGGMAIGSALGGRLADRVRSPLRLYGLLELALVAMVLATPITLRALHEVYRGAFSALEGAPLVLALVRFALALGILGPATILMGATLPTLTRYLSDDAAHLSAAFGRLYAANTFGAILGSAVSGLVLIELLGLSGTLAVGAACSAIAGAMALLLAWRRSAGARRSARDAATGTAAGLPGEVPGWVGRAATGTAAPDAPAPVAGPGPRVRLALGIAFVSGLTSLGYQVLWTRLLAEGTGNSTYVFTLILTVFLAGLAIGAAAFTVLRSRIRHTLNVLAWSQVLVAVLVLAGLLVIAQPPVIKYVPGRLDLLMGVLVQRVLLVVLPATIVMGLSFPAASALVAGDDGRIATNAGSLLAANTLGAITGTFVVPFFLIPLLGSPQVVELLALLNAATGVTLALWGRAGGRIQRLAMSLAGAAMSATMAWSLVAGGVQDPTVALVHSQHGTVFANREDEIASVQAGASSNGIRRLWVTGTSMTVLTVDAKLMPIMPLALRPASQTALDVGFGMGSAFRAGLIAGLRVDVAELVPSVPGMLSWYYGDAAQVLADPRGHVVIADGRNYVELTDHTYDIIVVDPPPPIESSGVSVISSREFYAAAHDRLTPGGVMMQWVPYGQTIDAFRAHVRTFRSVFAHVIIARGPGRYGFFMLGSDDPLQFTDANVRSVLARPGVLADLSSAFDSPEKTLAGWARRIPGLVWISGDQVDAFAGSGPLVTDDHPLPEYYLLRQAFGRPSPMVSPASLAAAGFP